MNEDTLRELYLDQGLSMRAVARALCCSQTNIRYWLAKYQIQRNQKHSYTGTDAVFEKVCPKCEGLKPLSSFYKRKSGIPGSWCKGCLLEQVLARQRKYKEQAVAYKGGSCISCGFQRYLGALEFHHLDPSHKDEQISRMSRSLETKGIRAELDKCVLLCANCHRMAHAELITFDIKGVPSILATASAN